PTATPAAPPIAFPPLAAPAAQPAAQPAVPMSAPSGVPIGTLLGVGARMLAAADPTQGERSQHFLLLHEIVAEARSIGRMFVDPRYKMSWWGRLAPLFLVLAFLPPSLWLPWPNLGSEAPPAQPSAQGQPAVSSPSHNSSLARSVVNKFVDLLI